jgi:hypothetical protein
MPQVCHSCHATSTALVSVQLACHRYTTLPEVQGTCHRYCSHHTYSYHVTSTALTA